MYRFRDVTSDVAGCLGRPAGVRIDDVKATFGLEAERLASCRRLIESRVATADAHLWRTEGGQLASRASLAYAESVAAESVVAESVVAESVVAESTAEATRADISSS